MKYIIPFLLLFLITSCKNETNTASNSTESDKTESTSDIRYAQGFTISNHNMYSVITIKNPWPKSDKQFKYALLRNAEETDSIPNLDEFDGVLATPIQKIVVTSTTHIPALELLGVEQTLVGFPGTNYVSSIKTRVRINNGEIRELGNNEGINTEVLLDLKPDAVITFGVDGTNKTMEVIKRAGIPVIYNGDWVEKSPLAKAEWIKFFGVLFQKEKEANSIFNQIETDYLQAKKIALNATSRPTVLCGAMHKDVWYLPNGLSPEAQFLNDANANYLWSDTTESGSLALSFETVYEKGKQAELWISPSYYTSYKDLETANNHYAQFDAFKNQKIFTFSNTTGETGGVTYYELGVARPDLVLKDMIKICHPELLSDYNTTFFKPLK